MKWPSMISNSWPLHVQGDGGHPSSQGGGQEKNHGKKWRAGRRRGTRGR
jgi:hypothetical protein